MLVTCFPFYELTLLCQLVSNFLHTLKFFYYKAINKDDRQYSGVGWNTTDIFREKLAQKENKFCMSSNWKTSTKLKN